MFVVRFKQSKQLNKFQCHYSAKHVATPILLIICAVIESDSKAPNVASAMMSAQPPEVPTNGRAFLRAPPYSAFLRIHYKPAQPANPSGSNAMLRFMQNALTPQQPQSGYFHTFLLPARKFFNNLSLPIGDEKDAHDALIHVFDTFCTAAQMGASDATSSAAAVSDGSKQTSQSPPRSSDIALVEGTKLDRKRAGRQPFAPYAVADAAFACSFWPLTLRLAASSQQQQEPVLVSSLRAEQTDGDTSSLAAAKSSPSEGLTPNSDTSSTSGSEFEADSETVSISVKLGLDDNQNADTDSGGNPMNTGDDLNKSPLMRETRKLLGRLNPLLVFAKPSETGAHTQTTDELHDLDSIGKTASADELFGIHQLEVTESLVSGIGKRLTNMQDPYEEPVAAEKIDVSSELNTAPSKPSQSQSLAPQRTKPLSHAGSSSNSLLSRLNPFASRSDESSAKSAGNKGSSSSQLDNVDASANASSTAKSGGTNLVSAFQQLRDKVIEATTPESPSARALALVRQSCRVYAAYNTRVILFQ